MVTVPVSFQYKDVQGVKTHGVVRDDGGRKGDDVSKEEKDWNKAVSGLRAEQRIFDELQRQFSDQPCLLINGFNEHDLIKVVKSKLQKKGKCAVLTDEVKLLELIYFWKIRCFVFEGITVLQSNQQTF